VIYKIIFKVLANRIKRLLPTLIGSSQTTFLKGKELLNSILVANEVVKDIKREEIWNNN